METVAEVAERIGIPAEKLEDLIELPTINQALVMARDDPSSPPEGIWAALELPVIDPDGLDIEALERELEALRRIATKGDGSRVPLQHRALHPMLKGRLELAERQAERRLSVIFEVHELMTKHYAEPGAWFMDRVQKLLVGEINLSGGRAREDQ